MGSACCSSKDKAASATTPNTATRPEDTETPSESEYESDMSVSMSDAESYIVKVNDYTYSQIHTQKINQKKQ